MTGRAGGGRPAPFPAAMRRAALLLLAAVAACAPVYEPAFRLEMPRPLDAAARQCLTPCDRARDACFVPARAEFADCSERAILAQDQCRANAQIDYQICQRAYAPDGQTCGSTSASASAARPRRWSCARPTTGAASPAAAGP